MKRYWYGFFMAWGNFFWLPCPNKIWDEEARSEMLAMLCLHGLFMGGLWYGLALLVLNSSLSAALCALILSMFPFAWSGGIHLDGFMDCCDALKSGRAPEEKQRILKDSHSGAFAMIGLGMVFLACFAALLSLCTEARSGGLRAEPLFLPLLALPCLSRALSSDNVMTKKTMGHSQYASAFDGRERRRARAFIWICCLLSLFLIAELYKRALSPAGFFEPEGAKYGLKAAYALLGELALGFAASKYARANLGGMSGDVAGYVITLMETAALLLLAAA